ncbi:MAG: hypothetical protein EBQ56_15225 [Proteobacteria bacterium]|nr:hypothetical protein [Pseudomonadota bacterium]
MYIPPHFAENDRERLHAFMRANGFGTLVSVIDGAPFVTLMPFTLIDEGEHGTLLATSPAPTRTPPLLMAPTIRSVSSRDRTPTSHRGGTRHQSPCPRGTTPPSRRMDARNASRIPPACVQSSTPWFTSTSPACQTRGPWRTSRRMSVTR